MTTKIKPIKLTLVYRQDQNGNKGWCLSNTPKNFDTIEISPNPKFNQWLRSLCHDILEHNPSKDRGTVTDELKALGAVLYGRACNEYIPIATDLVSLVSDSDCKLSKPRGVTPELINTFEYELEANLGYQKEALEGFLFGCDTEGLLEVYTTEQLTKWFNNAMLWLVKGCNEAHERYGSDLNLIECWYNLQTGLQEVLPKVEPWEKVKINIDEDCQVKLTVV